MPPRFFFVIDVSYVAVNSGALPVICQAIKDSLDKLPGGERTQVGFLTFDSTMHFYNLASRLSQPQMMVSCSIVFSDSIKLFELRFLWLIAHRSCCAAIASQIRKGAVRFPRSPDLLLLRCALCRTASAFAQGPGKRVLRSDVFACKHLTGDGL